MTDYEILIYMVIIVSEQYDMWELAKKLEILQWVKHFFFSFELFKIGICYELTSTCLCSLYMNLLCSYQTRNE